MSELDIPESWARTSLADATVVEYGKGLTESNRKPGPYRVLASGGVIGSHNSFLYDKPLIVTGRKGSIGTVHKVDEPSWVIDTAFAIIPRSQLDVDYLYSFLKSVNFEELEASTAIPSLSREALYRVEVPIPPLGEQRRIVNKIESTFKRIEAIEKAVVSAESLLSKYREALLNKAFRGELVPQDPNDEPASKLLERIRAERAKQQDGKKKKKDELPPITVEEIPFEIPKSWEWVRLGEIVNQIQYGFTASSAPNGSHRFLRITDITINGVAWDKVPFCTPDVKDAEDLALMNGDILFARTGGTVGKSHLIHDAPSNAIFASYLIKVRPKNEAVMPEYLNLYFSSPTYWDFVTDNQRGAAQPNINGTTLGNLLVPLPPRFEQSKAVDQVRNALADISVIEHRLTELGVIQRNLRASILSEAFSGRLVPQDSSEGTGHQLLEQILATKADASAKSAKAPTKQGRSKK